MVEPAIIEVVQRYLAKVTASGIPVNQGIVFGSCARGDHHNADARIAADTAGNYTAASARND